VFGLGLRCGCLRDELAVRVLLWFLVLVVLASGGVLWCCCGVVECLVARLGLLQGGGFGLVG